MDIKNTILHSVYKYKENITAYFPHSPPSSFKALKSQTKAGTNRSCFVGLVSEYH